METHHEVIFLCILTYVLALILLVLSMTTLRIIKRFSHLPLIALLFVTASSIYVIAEIQYKGIYRTDSMAFTHYAAQLWLFPSWNPYPHDLQKALEMFSVDIDYVTLKPDGDLVTNLNYPALHFLIFTPFIYFGVPDMRWVISSFELATFMIIYWKSPAEFRPLVIVPLFAGSDLAINFTAGCLGDYLWVLPLLLTVFYLENPVLSGLTYGLACSVKQEPWILAPYLIIYMLRSNEGGLRRIKKLSIFTMVTVGAFILPNLFFILKDPGSWFNGVTTPFAGELIVVSQGISMVTQKGLLPLSKTFYTTLTAIAATLLFIYYVLYFSNLKNTLWAFPALIMWTSPRGLQNYFIYLIPICLAATIKNYCKPTEDLRK
ncbi:MAG: hypothetical protein QXH16_02150 [Candidatus Bathyarchaeia archaeon]